MGYEYEWKDEDGYVHRCQLGPVVSAAIREAAEEDAEQLGITVHDAAQLILSGLMAVEVAEEKLRRTA